MARATTSLPEPVSPSTKTGASEGATSSTWFMTSFNPVSAPMTESEISCRPSRERSERLSAWAASRSQISSRTRWSFSSATVSGSTRAWTTASCSSVNRLSGRATRIKAPKIPSEPCKGAANMSPESPAGKSPGKRSCSKRSSPRKREPSRHQLRILSRSAGVHGDRDSGGTRPGTAVPTATVSKEFRAPSWRRTSSISSGR